MQTVRQLLLYISVTSIFFLIVGLVKPWVMLWWEDVQNRRKVVKLYGSIAVLTYLVYWLLLIFS